MAKKILCDKCTGLCCKYFALPIETPEDKEDYDDIRWYLCHKNVTVFVEDGDWYIAEGKLMKNGNDQWSDDFESVDYRGQEIQIPNNIFVE